MDKALMYTLMGRSMKETELTTSSTALALRRVSMALSTQGPMSMGESTDKDTSFEGMALCIKESSETTSSKEKGLTSGMMGEFTLETGKTTKCMERENFNGRTDANILANTEMT